MVASTLVRILYEVCAVLIRARGKKAQGAQLIAIGAALTGSTLFHNLFGVSLSV